MENIGIVSVEVPHVDVNFESSIYSSCAHCYLNKWITVYVCMDCSARLDPIIYAGRYSLELKLEAKTPYDKNSLHISVGKMRGITIRFLLAFTRKYECWEWSSWEAIRNIIKPATEKDRCRFVELPQMAVNVGPANTFIAYALAGV